VSKALTQADANVEARLSVPEETSYTAVRNVLQDPGPQ
jgi:hypothetical protein